jgi:ACS family hexuronate transporter-like MFS transporter
MSIQAPASARPAVATGIVTGVKVGNYRWYVCGLLFFASVINYIDRQVIGILKPTLQQQFGWSELDYGDIVFSFQLAYAIGFLFAGRIMDRLGTRAGFAIRDRGVERRRDGSRVGDVLRRRRGGHARDVRPHIQRVGRRFHGRALRARAGRIRQLPGAIKTVAEWFPRKERAFATGIFNAGTNIGALLTPLIVPVITISLGWEWRFIATGALGFLWLALWWFSYRSPEEHPRVSQAELAHIRCRSA